MSYNNIRKKLNKYAEGGKMIPKYQTPFSVLNNTFEERMKQKELRKKMGDALGIAPEDLAAFSDDELRQMYMDDTKTSFGLQQTNGSPIVNLQEGIDFGSSAADAANAAAQDKNQTLAAGVIGSEFDDIEDVQGTVAAQNAAADASKKYNAIGAKSGGSKMSGSAVGGIVSEAVQKTVAAVDNAVMGDKNFSAQSQTIDSAVHGVSGALMKSGNPYAMAAGAALEGINFLTKAGGKNVQGYDVNINNSGYGTMGHMESEAGRVWDKWSGATARKLAKRNEQARMALAAMDISEDTKYEQEARANSVTNILQQNQIALAGGIDTSLLGN